VAFEQHDHPHRKFSAPKLFGNRSREAAFLFLGHVTDIQWNKEL
jgi:hypothetical protein